MSREEVLDRAKAIVMGERNTQYGIPEDSFSMIAKLWTAYLGNDIGPEDVAIMMMLLKVARLSGSGYQNTDSWVDIAGYAACGAEIAVKPKKTEPEIFSGGVQPEVKQPEPVTRSECCFEAAQDDSQAVSERVRCFEAEPEKPEPEDDPEDDGNDEVVERMKGTWSRKKIPLDIGKVRALHNAGWNVAKIADEMGVSSHTIYRALKGDK